jgi:hypothetical protein
MSKPAVRPEPRLTAFDVIRYLHYWNDGERPIVTDFRSRNPKARLDAFKRYLSAMKIARNFREGSVPEIYRVARSYVVASGTANPNELSTRFRAADLLSGGSNNAVVAASKILWLFDRRTVIMDSYNRKALKLFSGSVPVTYDEYRRQWKAAYERYLPQIDGVIERYQFSRILREVRAGWFKQRVFDVFLWNITATGNGRRDPSSP